MKTGFRWYDCIFIILFIYLFILQLQAVWLFTIDDMYISLRYAKNWVAGDGLLWNINAPPVEGYSNFSFVVLGALALILNSDPVIVLKAAGVIGLFLTTVFIYLITRFWFERRESFLPCIALLLYKGQIVWAVSGFETTVYQALICGAVYFSFLGLGYRSFPYSREKPHPTFFFLAGLLLSFAGMTRPEAPALMAVFSLLLYWDRPQSELKVYWKGIGFFLLPLLFIFLPYFLWRWNYYGFLFPNSVYCKGFINNSTALDKNYLKLIWPFVPFALFACFKKHDKRYYFLWLPSVIYLLMLWGSDTVAAFDNRLFLTAFVLLLPLSFKGMSDIVLMISKKRDEVYIRTLALISIYMALFLIPTATLSDYRYFRNNPVKGEQVRSKILHWLNTNAKKGDSVVLADAGYIPYSSDLNYIDSFCLNNISMTQYPKSQMYEQFCQNVLNEKPQVIILASLINKGEVLYTPGDNCLKPLLDERKDYKFVRSFLSSDEDTEYRYELYKKF